MSNFLVDLSSYTPVNYLWPRLVKKLGLDKARFAVRQALDLHSMHSDNLTLPVLFFETCGLALVNTELVRQSSGIPCFEESMVLLISIRQKTFQVLRQF